MNPSFTPQVQFADTGEICPIPDSFADRPLLLGAFDRADEKQIEAELNCRDYAFFPRVTLNSGSGRPGQGCARPEPIGPERIELLPAASSRLMSLALERVISAGGKERRTFYGPTHVILEHDPHTSTVRTMLCGRYRNSVAARAAHPDEWPGEILDLVFDDCARVALDPEEPIRELWRGRPALGATYVRVLIAPGQTRAWRKAVRQRSPNAEIRVLAQRRRVK